jgi:hypothetical protein
MRNGDFIFLQELREPGQNGQRVRRSRHTLTVVQIETVGPGIDHRTIGRAGYLVPERAFRTYSKELTPG